VSRAEKLCEQTDNNDFVAEPNVVFLDSFFCRKTVLWNPKYVVLGKPIRPKRKQAPAARAARAKELASSAIATMTDPSVPAEERAQRRHRLIKGPEEFQELRVDRPKAKSK